MDHDDTEAMIAAYAAGDPTVWEPLFDRLAPRLLGFFLRCVQEEGLAEDHVQATFVQLHRERRRYRPGTSGRRWVFATAVRVRVADRRCLEHPEPNGARHALSDRAPGESELDREVRQAIDNLARIERSIIHLHRFEHMSLEDIAGVLGWSQRAVRRHLFRAYRELREGLWPLSDDEAGP